MGTGARLASRRRCRRGQVEQRAVGEVRGVNPMQHRMSGAHWLTMGGLVFKLAGGVGLVDCYGKCGEYGRVVKQRAVGVQWLIMKIGVFAIGNGKWTFGY